MRPVKHLRLGAFILALILSYGAAGAQCEIDQIIVALDETLNGCAQCDGDLDGDEEVTVSDIIIALNESCFPTPTRTSTPTPTPILPTPTRTPTATRTATSGSPDVAGVWTEDQLKVASSNCNPATANVVAQVVAQVPAVCDTELSQEGAQVHGVDCEGSTNDGTVDAAGVVRFTPLSQTQTFGNGCVLTASQSQTFDASHSPTTGMYTLQLSFAGPCSPFASCTAHLESRLRRR